MRTISILIGRLLYALFLILFGILHLLNASALPALLGVQIPIFLLYTIGGILIITGLCILINKYTNIACSIIVLICIGFILFVHLPTIAYGGDTETLTASIYLLKDLGLLGAALIIGGLYEPKKN